MRKSIYAVAAVLAAGAFGVGVVSALAPAQAAPGPAGPSATAPGYRMGGGMGPGGGSPGPGIGTGTCPLAPAAPSGTLTAAHKNTLAATAQQQKLAHDLYRAFAGNYPSSLFDRIATAQARHLATVRALLDRYQIADPTAGKAAGQFADTDVQATYEAYLREGNRSQSAAYRVAATVERADIATLRAAQDGLQAPDVQLAYQHLLMASQHHLVAFTR